MDWSLRVAAANQKLRRVKISRKSETNEWVVKVIGEPGDSKSYFTDDPQDAINTARHMDWMRSKSGALRTLKSMAKRKAPKASRSDKQIGRKAHIGRYPGGDYVATLRENGKIEYQIRAAPAIYDRILVAVDLWTRGASKADIERAVGKHIDR